MPDADDDKSEEYDGSVFSEDIDQNLQDWLGVIRSDSMVEILNTEQEAQDKKPSEYSRDSNGHQNPKRSRP